MVRLSKIYTKVGDGGTTMLGDGATVSKACRRVAAYGAVDEANAALGLAILAMEEHDSVRTLLASVQHDLFDVGADLCVPVAPKEADDDKLRIQQQQVDRLEHAIDEHNAALEPLNSFVLPGGTAAAAHLHVARTVVRRAEREVAALLAEEPAGTNPVALVFLNRLSDLLFVLARCANRDAGGDVLWKPGASRS